MCTFVGNGYDIGSDIDGDDIGDIVDDIEDSCSCIDDDSDLVAMDQEEENDTIMNGVNETEDIAVPAPALPWHGFKLVGDNLDKHVKPRHMTMNKQCQSLNYFHSYAVKDRINLSQYSSNSSCIDIGRDVLNLLPSNEVHMKLLKNIRVLVARILVDNVPVFQLYFEDAVERHITHTYSFQMSQKSEVVREMQNVLNNVTVSRIHCTVISLKQSHVHVH